MLCICILEVNKLIFCNSINTQGMFRDVFSIVKTVCFIPSAPVLSFVLATYFTWKFVPCSLITHIRTFIFLPKYPDFRDSMVGRILMMVLQDSLPWLFKQTLF